MDKILVTGGAGYIGSKLCYELLDKKKKVIVIDNLSTGSIKLLPKKIRFIKGDLNDTKLLKKIFSENRIQTIFHMAACTDVRESMINPGKYYLNNVEATRNILDIANNKIKNFIFASTCALYDVSKHNVVSEKDNLMPQSVYGITKYLSEKLIINYAKINKFNYGILRYFNVAGCDEKNRTGFIKNGPLFNNLAQNIAKNKFNISIYGKNFPTKDGTAIRDYIYIEDLIDYHLRVLELIKKKSHILNLGYGEGFSVKQVVDGFEKIKKIKIKKKYLSSRKGEMSKIICDNKKLNSLIKKKINKKVLEKMIETSINWSNKWYNQ